MTSLDDVRPGVAAASVVPAGVSPLSVEEKSPLISRLHTPEGRARALEALRSFDDDEEEQRETGEYLARALDEDRLSDRRVS